MHTHDRLFRASVAMPSVCLLLLAAGCDRTSADASRPGSAASAPAEAAVQIVTPVRKTVRHPIEQPGFNIGAFEETALFTRVTAYVAKWHADIGDQIRKDAVLAELEAPEMEVE